MLSTDGVHVPAIVYVSGPMSGQADHGAAAFEKARHRLRELGYSVLCPSECTVLHNTVEKKPRAFHLRRDAQMVMLADEVCVLPGWEHSPGAVWEVAIALGLGLPVWEFESGRSIESKLKLTFDIRRSFMPIDFEGWSSEPTALLADDGEADCEEMHIPFRGASAAYCALRHGHDGLHRDRADRTWS